MRTLTIIKNFSNLVGNAPNELNSKAREIALQLLESAITASNPRNLIKKKFQIRKNLLNIDSIKIDLNEYNRIIVVGAGKASGAMAEAIESILGKRVTTGFVNVPRNTALNFKTQRIKLNEAGHPIPDEDGLKGTKKLLELLNNLQEDDLVLSLISGGGSALLPLPTSDITLLEKQEVTNSLLRSGATIDEINTIRKHISEIKGGRLAKHAYPATLVCLIISDVVGDPLPIIASGPTLPDPSTYVDAVDVLKRYNIWEKTPKSIREHLNNGVKGIIPDSPKQDDPCFKKVYNIILGSNRIALISAEATAKKLGFKALILSSFIEGEARHVGTVFASLARESVISKGVLRKPIILLAGGETTVTVTGNGKGGRNQELVLSASTHIKGFEGLVIASLGTDGVEGLTDAAGAIADGSTTSRATNRGFNPLICLGNNDSYSFFKILEDLIITGPTGTNVNDITVVVSL